MIALSNECLSEVCHLLWERAGIDPDSCGVDTIAHVVRQRAAASGDDSPQHYSRRLLTDATEFQELLEDIVVPETWFFRDIAAFRAVRSFLNDNRSQLATAVRCLSVACSTGEEVYSLAMTIREVSVERSQLCIVGTDVSRRSLASAHHGSFAARSFRDPDQQSVAMRNRWCEQTGDLWRVRDELRTGVEFRWGNLAQPDFLATAPTFDVIFCRNVLIYFHAEARRVALRHLERLLSPNGLLCCAAAEAHIFTEAGFGRLSAEYPFAFCRAVNRGVACEPAKSQFPSSPLIEMPLPLPQRRRTGSAVAAATRGDARNSKISAFIETVKTPSADTSMATMLREAQQAADHGRLDKAETLCDQMLAREPGNAEAYCLRGVVRQAQGLLEVAQECFEKALYLNPRHYRALVHMMLLAEHRGNRSLAENYRRRAAQSKPKETT